jgi:hypothetical protein
MARRTLVRPREAPTAVLVVRGMVAPVGRRTARGFGSPGGATIASDGQASYTAIGGDSAQQ